MMYYSLFYYSGKVLDAMNCEKGYEISTDIYHIQRVLKQDMTLRVNFILYSDIGTFFIEKESSIKRDK
jgi:hypothetical protein